jgi:hypothetical protein
MAAPNGEDAANQAVADAGEDGYENVLFTTNTLPGANTNIGTAMAAVPTNTSRQQAIDFYNFLQEEDRQLLTLNIDHIPRTALISIPGSVDVKVVFGASIGASTIGQHSPIDNKVLVLHGDGGNDIGTPQPLVLPVEVLDTQNVAVMSLAQCKETLTTKGAEFTYPLLARNRINSTQEIMQFAPIPSFLILDSFNQNINAALVLERLLSVETDGIEMYSHLQHFLLACLSAHNLNNNKPYVEQQVLFAPPVNEARIWARSKFKSIFPALQPPAVPVQAPPGNNDLAAILAQFLPLQQQALQMQLNNQQNNNNNGNEEEKKEDEQVILGMSHQELAATLVMCGHPPNAHHSVLPQWFQDCAEKGMTEAYRLMIIRKHIMANFKYDEAEVPITLTMLKNFNKRNWLGKDGNIKRPSLLNASEGLSPFIVLDLDEDEVARINDTEDALTRASTVTMQDITNLKKKLTPKIPTSADDFMRLLKRFANLLFALFSDTCPFFQCIVKIINVLKEFSRGAKESMSKMTRASILWIILLQSRTFALGEDTILAEFTAMHAKLASKQGNIYHSEVPQALINESNPKQPTGSKRKHGQIHDQDKGSDPITPRNNPNNWHPLLKAKLAVPLAKAGNPSFTSIMQFVDRDPNEVIQDKSSWCTPNAFFGRCFLGEKCKRQHKVVTDAQADKILSMMGPFIAKPEDVKSRG